MMAQVALHMRANRFRIRILFAEGQAFWALVIFSIKYRLFLSFLFLGYLFVGIQVVDIVMQLLFHLLIEEIIINLIITVSVISFQIFFFLRKFEHSNFLLEQILVVIYLQLLFGPLL
jgi:hypothetical protein